MPRKAMKWSRPSTKRKKYAKTESEYLKWIDKGMRKNLKRRKHTTPSLPHFNHLRNMTSGQRSYTPGQMVNMMGMDNHLR